MRFIALRNIIGLGLPTKYGTAPVARVIRAATAPVAGSGPSADAYLRDLKSRISITVVRKPKASRARSREVYLVATGLKDS